MKLLLTCVLLLVGKASTTVYTNLTKAEDIEVHDYGTRTAKDIRNIGRSYAHNLLKKQIFTDYAASLPLETDQEAIQEYGETYLVHVIAVGAGLVLALFLFGGFCCSWTCCLCCNKSQKVENTAAMWRMIWGTIIIILLAANVAGVLIIFVSGGELMTLKDKTVETVEGVGGDIVKYLDETNNQIETLKSDEFPRFINAVLPIVNDSIKNCVADIQSNQDLVDSVDDITTGLRTLSTTITEVNSTVNNLNTSITTIADNVNTINDNLKVCKTAIETCDAAQSGSDKCSTVISASDFDPSFNVDDLQIDEIETVQTKIGEIATFDGKTLDEWATYVQENWDGLLDFTMEQAGQASTDFNDTLWEAEKAFRNSTKDVQEMLQSLSVDVDGYTSNASLTINATMQFLKDVILMKESSSDTIENTPDGLQPLGDSPWKWIFFGVFLFILLLAVLLILTILIGLVTTVLGCCKVDDELSPTDRKSGVCGNLMMCTSYFSVLLCAIATFAAAILLTPMMFEEGLCKQYSDNELIPALSNGITIEAMDNLSINLTAEIEKAIDIEGGLKVTVPEMMDNCKNGDTLVAALGITKDTSIQNISISSINDTIKEEIENFNVSEIVDGLSIDYDHVDTTDLYANKDALTTTFNFSDVKDTIQNTDLTGLSSISDAENSIQTLLDKGGDYTTYGLSDCKTGLSTIETSSTAIDNEKSTTVSLIDELEAKAKTAETEISGVIWGIGNFTDILTDAYIKGILVTRIEEGINTAMNEITGFVDYLFNQLKTTVLNCQPVSALYETAFNYSCDKITIQVTLIYLALSLIGIALLFYMCISRCLARYFLKYSHLHPADANRDWRPYPGNGYLSQTKL